MSETQTDFWRDKTVLITGASSGIGRALAEDLAARGARVGLIARRSELLSALGSQLQSQGARCAWSVADVRDARQTADAIARLESDLGPCQVLIAAAGIQRNSPPQNFNVADASDLVQTNLLGVIHAVGAVLPGMLQRCTGRIAVISSLASLLGLPKISVYCATKAALRTLMDGLGVDLRGTGVQLTTIFPGFVDTPLIAAHHPGVTRSKLTPQNAAARIRTAIERGRRECWFPTRTWLLARTAMLLPYPLYARLCRLIPSRSREAAGAPLDASTPPGHVQQPHADRSER